MSRDWPTNEDELDDPGRIVEMATRYAISLLPLDHRDAHLFKLDIEWRGIPHQVPEQLRGSWTAAWAVTWMGHCLAHDGTWYYEPIPSERTLDFCREHRFEVNEAFRRARIAVHNISVNGRRAVDVV